MNSILTRVDPKLEALLKKLKSQGCKSQVEASRLVANAFNKKVKLIKGGDY